MNLLGLFKRHGAPPRSTDAPTSEPQLIVATIIEHIMPLDCADRYEDPVDEVLAPGQLGSVAGGGSQLTATNEIASIDVEIEGKDIDAALPLIVGSLERSGAPVSSFLTVERDGEEEKIPYGTAEGRIILLDGVSLPDAVYQSSNIDELATMLEQAVAPGDVGEIRASWAGPSETAIAIYGSNAEQIFKAVEPIVRSYPLCRNARIVFKDATQSGREVRVASDASPSDI